MNAAAVVQSGDAAPQIFERADLEQRRELVGRADIEPRPEGQNAGL